MDAKSTEVGGSYWLKTGQLCRLAPSKFDAVSPMNLAHGFRFIVYETKKLRFLKTRKELDKVD